MGMIDSDLFIFERILPSLCADGSPPPRIGCLGYPDVTVSDGAYDRHFPGVDWRTRLRPRMEQGRVLTVHGAHAAQVSVVPDIESFFSLYGKVEIEVVDFTKVQGSEIVHNMNEPIPDDLVGRYDLLYDTGTLEHVFDVAQALFNCAKMVKLGGFVYHVVPMVMLNHGFYNFNPTLFYDFYQDNGFELAGCVGLPFHSDGNGPNFFDVPAYDRFRTSSEALIMCVVRKVRAVEKLVKPIQHRYRASAP